MTTGEAAETASVAVCAGTGATGAALRAGAGVTGAAVYAGAGVTGAAVYAGAGATGETEVRVGKIGVGGGAGSKRAAGV